MINRNDLEVEDEDDIGQETVSKNRKNRQRNKNKRKNNKNYKKLAIRSSARLGSYFLIMVIVTVIYLESFGWNSTEGAIASAIF